MEKEKHLAAEAKGGVSEKIKDMFRKVYKLESAKRIICRLAVFAIAGIVFEFFVAYAFSPLYDGLWDFDVPVFWEIGKRWVNGLLPYRDLMDLKGPLVFLVYRLGYMIFGDRMKMMAVFDVISFALSGAILCEAADVILESRGSKNTLLCLCIMILAAAGPWGPGGMVSVYTLPAVSLSWLFLVRWMKSDSTDHRPAWTAVYGVTFGLCMMSRMLDGVAIAVPCLWICICLIRKKKWKNLAENAVACAAGVILACAPFVIYFATHGALGEMLYGTFGMGARYYVNTSSFRNPVMMIVALWYSTIITVPVLWSLTGIKNRFRDKSSRLVFFSAIIAFVILFATKASEFYCISYIPMFITSVFFLIGRTGQETDKSKNKISQTLFLTGILIVIFSNVFTMSEGRKNIAASSVLFDHDVSSVMRHVSKKDRKNLIFYDLHMKYYEEYRTDAAFKYFTNQSWEIASIGKSYKKRLADRIIKDGPKYIAMRVYTSKNSYVSPWPSRRAGSLYRIKSVSGSVVLFERTGKKENNVTIKV